MADYFPVLMVAAIILLFAVAFVIAYAKLKKATAKDEKERTMSDREIVKRLLGFAKPYKKQFALVFIIMLISIGYDLLSPILVGNIQNLVKGTFTLNALFARVIVYAGILVVSLVSMYLQTMILQKVGQQILSDLRLSVFTHIESLSHEQLNNIPVGKLGTRVTNDTNGISMMFTNVLVTMV